MVFASFFATSAVCAAVSAIVIRIRPPSRETRATLTRRLNRVFGWLASVLVRLGLVRVERPELPHEHRGRAFLLVANHPTLLDVVLLLGAFPELVAVVKAEWYRSWVLGPLLRLTEHVPGPGHEGDERSPDAFPVVSRIADKLRGGAPVLVFPEGTRSKPRALRRFRRGAIEAAVQAGVPVLPIFVGVDRAFLQKGMPVWEVPDVPPRYALEWLPARATAGADARHLTRDLAQSFGERLARSAAQEAT